jgi:hypothetical protein
VPRMNKGVILISTDHHSSQVTRRRCIHSTCKLNKNYNKYANICSHCTGFFCNAHSEKMTTVIVTATAVFACSIKIIINLLALKKAGFY